MKIRYLILAAALSLAACANVQPEQTLATACDGYATALDALTPLKTAGKLSAQTISAIDVANHLIDPLCQGPTPPADLASAVAQATVQLHAIKGVQ